MLTNPRLAEACRVAAETIRAFPERWTQRSYYGYRGAGGAACQACAVGMVALAYNESVEDVAEVESLLNDPYRIVIGGERPGYGFLHEFNDAEGQTPEGVASVLDKMALVLS